MLDKLKNKKINFSVFITLILILILICAFVLFFEVKNYRNYKEEKYKLYYYFTNDKVVFDATAILNYNKKIELLKTPGVQINSIPLYFVKYPKQLILPNEMEIVFPYKVRPLYRVGNFSKLYYNANSLYINTDTGVGQINDCFFYDGNDIYVFVKNTTVYLDDEKYDLSPLSYIDVNNNYIKIYDEKNNNFIYKEKQYNSVMAYTSDYFIDLKNDSFTYNKNYYLLIKNINNLDDYDFKLN